MQKISLFHLFILEIQANFRAPDVSGHTYSWPCLPNHFLINFLDSWICIKMQKIWIFPHTVLDKKKYWPNFSKNLKNIYLALFPSFWAIFFFFKKFGPVTQDFIWVSNTILKFRKNIQFQEHVQIEGWKDAQTLFYRILQATAGVEIWMVLSKKLFSSLSVINNTKCFFIQNLRTFTESSVLPLSRFRDVLFPYDFPKISCSKS